MSKEVVQFLLDQIDVQMLVLYNGNTEEVADGIYQLSNLINLLRMAVE